MLLAQNGLVNTETKLLKKIQHSPQNTLEPSHSSQQQNAELSCSAEIHFVYWERIVFILLACVAPSLHGRQNLVKMMQKNRDS